MQTIIVTTIIYSLYSIITTILVVATLALSARISRLEEEKREASLVAAASQSYKGGGNREKAFWT